MNAGEDRAATVALPQGTPSGDFTEWRGFCDDTNAVVWTAQGAGYVMIQNVEPGSLKPAETRALAAALLAAAVVAEAGS